MLAPYAGTPARRGRAWFWPGLVAPQPATRIATLALRRHLDRALAEGVDLTRSKRMAARAVQLNTATNRVKIARAVERLLENLHEPPSHARVMPSRQAILANRAELMELASLLRSPMPLYVQGIAMLGLTVTDGTGPAYVDRRGEALARQLGRVRVSLTA